MLIKYIRNIKYSHLNAIVGIEGESYRNPWTKEHFDKDINHPCSINYGYIKDNELRGYLFGYLIENEYHLNKITVKEIYRQRNIGKQLFLYCLNKLKSENVKCIQLEVSSLNLIAQNFYKNLDFICNGLRKDYYSKDEDALLYTLRLK